MEGILLVNKDPGMTSHDVVDKVRRILKIRKVGHAGTLDPLATGLLVVLVGKATKLSEKFLTFDKAYRAQILLGVETDTEDIEGKVLKKCENIGVSKEELDESFSFYSGEFDQMVPMYSAVKVNGKKLYEYARKGIEVERPVRRVTISQLEIERFESPYVDIYMECSKGTYVRQLADDVGKRLGCGACISKIQRIKVGPFHLKESLKVEEINESCLRNWTV